ncbi:MAG: recombination mediator RecR [Candidatus Omnitrophota bacterium]|nr:recombination mediator RecR [Candidatus Omnitrophota bacterium]
MASTFPLSFQVLIDKLVKFPGIGRRSAERIVHFILNKLSLEEIKSLSEAMVKLKESIRFCSVCHNISEDELCNVCKDTQRDKGIVCIVEEPKDVIAIEKTGIFRGVYHVLMGSLSPLDGRGPEDLSINELISRLNKNSISEIIIATDSDTEGETTALYLAQLLKPKGIKVTRIGMGIPLGSNIDYLDNGTIIKALEARRAI